MSNTELILSEIYIYPIKSLGGISLSESEVTDRGPKYDRRWMLIDKNNCFMTQRDYPHMSQLQTEIIKNELIVYHKNNINEKIIIPLDSDSLQSKKEKALIWSDKVDVKIYENEINEWFSEIINDKCRLVFMPDESLREVDKRYSYSGDITSLSDGYPFLIIGQESLNLLNSKLKDQIPINRFRPNLVFSGGKPHEEDNWKEFCINEITFYPIKPCARCVITTIDQDSHNNLFNGSKSKEPLHTLSFYRKFNNKVLFGMNLLHKGRGIIKVGDRLIIG